MKFKRGVEVVGSTIIENNKGEILLVKSPKWSNKWLMPGGHIDPGEKIIKALERETKEETGLKIKPINIIAFGELINSKDFHRPAHFIYFDLLAKTLTKKIKIDNKEIKDYKWVKPKEAIKMDLAESYPETIKKYMKFKENKLQNKI